MPASMRDASAVPLARPHRPVLVAGTLGELAGPTRGLVELPLRLWWNPRRAFDLSQPTMLAWMYENVLREAIRVEELRAYLDGPTLVRVWPQLNLPRAVRAAWEARHPRLRLATARQRPEEMARQRPEETARQRPEETVRLRRDDTASLPADRGEDDGRAGHQARTGSRNPAR